MTIKRYKVQSLSSLRREMIDVARGRRPAPADAARPSFESVAVIVGLLTPENRHLMALIRDHKPASVGELAKLSGRAQPNVTRTLAKLQAAGFVTMTSDGRRKMPCAAIRKITIEIDPYSNHDRLKVA
jgi:predicted transcriptional regulator